jgi:hypothetical protein
MIAVFTATRLVAVDEAEFVPRATGGLLWAIAAVKEGKTDRTIAQESMRVQVIFMGVF